MDSHMVGGFGRAPKIPIGAAGNPHFADFMNPVASPTAATHHLSGSIRQKEWNPLLRILAKN